MGARELELMTTGEKRNLGTLAERVLADFYSVQLARSRRERERWERTPSGPRTGSAKWNRQELYIDEDRRERACVASRRHLARHPEWLEGLARLDEASLSEVVAMQHYLEVDLEDLSLPEAERRSEDTYSGAGGNICNQMLLDAARSAFMVDGEEFDFSAEVAGHGEAVEANPCDVERLQQALSDRLVAAVMRCLGDEPPPLLLRAVTTTMSQSGLANVERACNEPQVVVCGGDHHLRYELSGLEAGVWELSLFTRKFGFEQCIVYGATPRDGAPGEEPLPAACSSSSSASKLCRVRLRVGPGGGVDGDVVELRKELRILDRRGRQLRGLTSSVGRRRSLWEPLRAAAELALRICTRCALGCSAACASAYFAACAAYGRARARVKLAPDRSAK